VGFDYVGHAAVNVDRASGLGGLASQRTTAAGARGSRSIALNRAQSRSDRVPGAWCKERGRIVALFGGVGRY
jgi:hypothetical protein